MRIWIVPYIATAVTFFGLDAIWLGLTATRLYRPQLGDLLLDNFRPLPAIAFYILYVAGILIFAEAPAIVTGRWTTALVRGAMLGLLAYATYDLTNQATLRGWSSAVTIADLCWGTVLTATAATVGFMAARWVLAHG
jgi:uncharacterized membrane protein